MLADAQRPVPSHIAETSHVCRCCPFLSSIGQGIGDNRRARSKLSACWQTDRRFYPHKRLDGIVREDMSFPKLQLWRLQLLSCYFPILLWAQSYGISLFDASSQRWRFTSSRIGDFQAHPSRPSLCTFVLCHTVSGCIISVSRQGAIYSLRGSL